MTEQSFLREVASVLSLARDYGAAVPASIEAARDVHLALRRNPPTSPDRVSIGALALDQTPAKAARALMDARAAQEVHAASREVAARRVLEAVAAQADVIVSAVLSSPVLEDAVQEIASAAPATSPGVRHFPAPGAPEADVINAARLRQAEEVLTSAAGRLTRHTSLGVSFDDARLPLIWIDPSEVQGRRNFNSLDRALRAVRPGAIDAPVHVIGSDGSPIQDQTAHGIASAIAADVPGVRFSLIATPEEFDARVACVTDGLRPDFEKGGQMLGQAVVWA